MSGRKRKQLYIDPTVQRALVRRILFHWASFIALSLFLAVSLHFLVENPFQSLSGLFGSVLKRHGVFLVALLTLLPVFILDTIEISNRFAGPMMRFRRAVRSLAQGEQVKPLKFRDGDFWAELAEDFNRVLERVRDPKQAPSAGPSDKLNQEAPVAGCK